MRRRQGSILFSTLEEDPMLSVVQANTLIAEDVLSNTREERK